MLSLREIFSHIYHHQLWGPGETVSGSGARLEEARALIHILPELMRLLELHSLLDAGCGDFNWMRHVPLANYDYCGVDLVPELIAANQAHYSRPGLRFAVADLARDPLPAADLVLLRNVMTHLSFRQGLRCLANLRHQPCAYLLASHYPELSENHDLASGLWHPLNLTLAPFHLPPPLKAFPEAAPGCVLGLWPGSVLSPEYGSEPVSH